LIAGQYFTLKLHLAREVKAVQTCWETEEAIMSTQTDIQMEENTGKVRSMKQNSFLSLFVPSFWTSNLEYADKKWIFEWKFGPFMLMEISKENVR
jgi:hypothetical protein